MKNTIKIEKLIYEGWGIGHFEDGQTVFVKKVVPGDVVKVKPSKTKKSYIEATAESVITPGPDRVTPDCPYFDQCGGCDHQNIGYPNQLKYKAEIFAETLKRQGIEISALPILPCSSNSFFYRNSIRFFFIQNSDDTISFARHHYLYSNGFVPVESCLLQSETANQIMHDLKKYINDNVEHKGSFWQLKIREGKQTGELIVEIITSSEDLPNKEGIVALLKNINGVKSLYHTVSPAKSLKVLRRRLLFGSPIIHEKIGSFSFQISPESFFQTNSLGVKSLYDTVKKYAEVGPKDTVLDLYCGTGTIGIYLSTMAKKVIGVESVREAVNDAIGNARLNRVHNTEFICADSEEWLNKSLAKSNPTLDIIIVDPPRAGLTRNVIELLSKANFQRLIYVSCNPATFARDIKSLQEQGIELKKVQPVDMFPQTHHIECVGLLLKAE